MQLLSASIVVWTQLQALGIFSSSLQLFQPTVIFSCSCLFIAIPVHAMPSLFSNTFFMDICLGSFRRLNFLMEGTLPVPLLYPPDNNYCWREAQGLRSLCDLLKVTSNQQWSKSKHKYVKRHQLCFKLGPSQKAHPHLHCSHESVPTNAIFYPRKERCPVCRSEEVKDDPTIKKINWLMTQGKNLDFFFLNVWKEGVSQS